MIYLDNAATTKTCADCLKRAEKFLLEDFYNPSALYAEGYAISKEIKSAATQIISTIADEGKFSLVFTSCGTEADNQAIFSGGRRGNIVTTLGEHSAVYSAVTELKQRGLDVRFACLNEDGSVNVENLLSLIDEKTSLVSVIHINNETGAVNDIQKISSEVKAKNKNTLFHSDGVQAFGKIPFKLPQTVDLYSISGHKIGAVKGIAALIKRKNLVLKPLIYGGGQQNGLRSGTENVFGIKIFEYASVKKYANIKENYKKINDLKCKFTNLIDKSLFKVLSGENSSPYILTLGVSGVRGETIMHEVNDRGLIIGTGSACSSNENKRHSRVLTACGVANEFLDGILRISFCVENTDEEIVQAAEILNSTVKNRKEIMK